MKKILTILFLFCWGVAASQTYTSVHSRNRIYPITSDNYDVQFVLNTLNDNSNVDFSTFPLIIMSNPTDTAIVDWGNGDLPMLYIGQILQVVFYPTSGNHTIKIKFSDTLSVTQIFAFDSYFPKQCNFLSIDVTPFQNLNFLDCNNNSLTSLDVTHNPSLSSLQCAGNSLTSLDVTHNPSLSVLQCNSNSLTSLDVNNILSVLVLNNLNNGYLYTSAQTPPAPPTGQGITDAAILASRNWAVITD